MNPLKGTPNTMTYDVEFQNLIRVSEGLHRAVAEDARRQALVQERDRLRATLKAFQARRAAAAPRAPDLPQIMANCIEGVGYAWVWSVSGRKDGTRYERGRFSTMGRKASEGPVPVLWRHQGDALGRVISAGEDHIGLQVRVLLNPPRTLFEQQIHDCAKAGMLGLSLREYEYRPGLYELSLVPEADNPAARLMVAGPYR